MRRAALLVASLLCWAPPGAAQDHGAHESPGAGRIVRTSRQAIPDLPVVTQDGAPVRFYRDLVKGKAVAINFIYTTCTTICPVLGAAFTQTQQRLGDRVGREVALISVSIDPVVDTPERLKAWGAKFDARPGWTMVTGKKADIDALLRGLGALVARKDDHPPLVIVGNDATGVWTRVYGLVPVADVLTAVLNGAQASPPGPGASRP